MYTACYLRCSTAPPKKGNKKPKQTTQSQRPDLEQYIKDHRIKNVKWFEDKRSGRNMKNRDNLSRILADCRAGKCGCILVWKLDRLARNCLQTLQLIEELQSLNVTVISVSQGLVFDDSGMSRFILQIFAAVAELESRHIGERTKAGQAVARKNGQVWGGSKPNKQKRHNIRRSVEKRGVAETASKYHVSRQSVYQILGRMAS